MKVDFDYEIGDIVYLKTDSEQWERIITACIVRDIDGDIQYYELSLGENVSVHAKYEITLKRRRKRYG